MSIVTMLVVMISDRRARSALCIKTDKLEFLGRIIEELTITKNENKSRDRHVDSGNKNCQRKIRTMTGFGLEISHEVWISVISRVALAAVNCM